MGLFFPRISFLFSSSLSLWETAQYRQKYCLKEPLNPKRPTTMVESGWTDGQTRRRIHSLASAEALIKCAPSSSFKSVRKIQQLVFQVPITIRDLNKCNDLDRIVMMLSFLAIIGFYYWQPVDT